MTNIKMYTKPTCPYCNGAKALLKAKGVEYEDVDVNDFPNEREKISEENDNYSTVPMILINKVFIGGYSELQDLEESGKLDDMLNV